VRCPTSSCASSKGQTGLVEAATFRAFDAEPEIGKGPAGKRVTLELPALGQNIPCRSTSSSGPATRPTTRSSTRSSAPPTGSSGRRRRDRASPRHRAQHRQGDDRTGATSPPTTTSVARRATPSPPATAWSTGPCHARRPADLVGHLRRPTARSPGAMLMSNRVSGARLGTRVRRRSSSTAARVRRPSPRCRGSSRRRASRRSTSTTVRRHRQRHAEGHPGRQAAAPAGAGRRRTTRGHRAGCDLLGSDPDLATDWASSRPSSPASSRACTATRSPR
jgi:hypothetical protein